MENPFGIIIDGTGCEIKICREKELLNIYIDDGNGWGIPSKVKLKDFYTAFLMLKNLQDVREGSEGNE